MVFDFMTSGPVWSETLNRFCLISLNEPVGFLSEIFFLESVLITQPCRITVKVRLANEPVWNRLWANGILNKPKIEKFSVKIWCDFSHFYDCLNFNSFNFCLEKINTYFKVSFTTWVTTNNAIC
jgi:hypothetical protein